MERKILKGHLSVFSSNLIWGMMSPISKSIFMLGMVSAVSLTSIRMVCAAVLFWIASLFMKPEKVTRRDLLLLFAASFCAITFNQGIFVLGISYTTPIDASVIASLVPVFTMVLAALIQKEPMTVKKIVGVLLGLSGALGLILFGAHTGAGEARNALLGNTLCLIAEIFFSLYLVLFKGLINRYSSITLMKWMFLFASLCCLPFTGREVLSIPYSELPISTWLSLLYVVLGATFLCYILMPIAQKSLRPTVVSMYNYVQPVVSAVLAILWGLDNFTFVKAVSILLVFVGVYVVTQSKSRAQIEVEKARKAE